MYCGGSTPHYMYKMCQPAVRASEAWQADRSVYNWLIHGAVYVAISCSKITWLLPAVLWGLGLLNIVCWWLYAMACCWLLYISWLYGIHKFVIGAAEGLLGAAACGIVLALLNMTVLHQLQSDYAILKGIPRNVLSICYMLSLSERASEFQSIAFWDTLENAWLGYWSKIVPLF